MEPDVFSVLPKVVKPSSIPNSRTFVSLQKETSYPLELVSISLSSSEFGQPLLYFLSFASQCVGLGGGRLYIFIRTILLKIYTNHSLL